MTGGDERVLAGYLLFWVVAAAFGNLLSGRLVDRFESRRVINAILLIAIANFCLLPCSTVW